jgi:hypothetical protein
MSGCGLQAGQGCSGLDVFGFEFQHPAQENRLLAGIRRQPG